ncbi:MAG: hypothetical protein WC530_03365 [Candidatus Omnitrophota bacterium]|jgi:hypothetical protein
MSGATTFEGALKKGKYMLSVLVILAFFIIPNTYAGKAKLTTYYPVPHGDYKNVNSKEGFNFATISGNVGIGAASPGYTLTLNGQPRANGYTVWT